MRNEPWRDETRSEAERADWDKARYEGAEPYIGKLEAEIDRLTARCEAMEAIASRSEMSYEAIR